MNGWIGVDLDGTLAHYEGWKGADNIGPPVQKMLERVKAWLAQGREVRIFTARVSRGPYRDEAVRQIKQWLLQHGLPDLEVTNEKDYGMVELWDDRCVQVQANTGDPVSEFWRHTQ